MILFFVYINGHLPVFTHESKDTASFRFFTTQLIANGSATQGDIVSLFDPRASGW